jgi:hypothetical protein
MCIKWACFISYPHAQGDLVKNFTKQLRTALENEIGTCFPKGVGVYMDELRLEPGFDWHQALTMAICESVCMIVVFVPVYEEKIYCLREFAAMEHIEEKRKKKLGGKYDATRRMILPIILRGDPDDLPLKISDIHYSDFSQFTLATLNITTNVEYTETIRKITAGIFRLYRDIRYLKHDCSSFRAPSAQVALRSWKKSKRGKPGFPGRIEGKRL